jgi:pseudomonalisin
MSGTWAWLWQQRFLTSCVLTSRKRSGKWGTQTSSFVSRTPSFISTILVILVWLLSFNLAGNAQPVSPEDPLYVQPKDRIAGLIDDEQRVTLRGNVHPLATAQYDLGSVLPEYPLQRMILTLLPDPEQQAALDQFVEAQHNPESPYYHQWLSPEQYAERYGVSEHDVAQVTAWLQGHGMEVEEVTAGRRSIVFSGTAAQVQTAFHTAIHVYNVNGEIHHANVKDPEIPAVLAQVVGGVVSLHDFRKKPMHSFVHKVTPDFTYGGSHYLAPGDFATIYDLGPAYGESITGTGQAVAIVARSNVKMSDVTSFRSYFGLPANNPTIIVNGTNPGIWNSDEETEADLDIEWSGAVAKNATIDFVVSQSTNSTDGVDLSAQYIVNHNLAPAMSTSFGECEQWEGSSGNSFFNNLWEQAASEGITAFISAGDSGAAGCDYGSESTAQYPLGVNALCSSPYDVCVGGTEFNDGSDPSLYWSSTNASAQASALSYIPEVVWNESGANGGSGLWAGGGGASTVYNKPSWQTGTGVPSDGKRDVPDVSLTAAGHDGYLIFQEGGMYVVGGTSAASPSFAGLMALVVQNVNAWQGNANATFYPLATKQASGGAAVFHDITSGNNSVPGLTGYNATVGYDRASGLGSVDASVMINHWSDASTVPTFHAALSSSSTSVIPGSSSSITVTVTVSNGFKAAIALAITGLPTGVTGAFTPATLPSPGSGTSTLKLTAASTATAGSYSATITATSGTTKQQITLPVTVEAAPTFSLGSSSSSVSIEVGGAANTVTITATPNSTFNAAIAFTVTGLPVGVTGSFTPVTIAAPGSGSTVLKLTAASTAKAGSYTVTVTGTSGTLKKTVSISLTVRAG